ncbi:MAG: hypothetical protein ACYTHM_05005 [Planctomycetota bacterium]|jgi:hypothetical protein
MWRWIRLFWLLAALGGAGILVVHSQTSVVSTGYRVSAMLETREGLREKNRTLRIQLGRASVPGQVRESYKALSTMGEESGSEPAAGGGEPPSGTTGETKNSD